MDSTFTTTPLRQAYLSRENIDRVHAALEAAIRARGHQISRQSDTELMGVMRGVFETYSTDAAAASSQEITRLNAIVLDVVVPQVLTGIQQYLGYIKDASTLPVPLARGVNASNKGSRTLELR